MSEPQTSPLALAEHVAAIAATLGIETALIGALALAANGYVRATLDADLATAVDPFTKLRELEDALRATGMRTLARMPDADDALGGVLKVWIQEDEEGDPIEHCEVVNFTNPWRPRPTPAQEAIATADSFEGTSLRCVRLPSLVALKLAAGSLGDYVDVLELLANNPDADLDEVRRLAAPYDARHELETLIADSVELRRRG